jgi:predicted DNA-binding protein with PD1-like motif
VTPLPLRLAGADAATEVMGDVETPTLAGSVAAGGSHLRMSVAACLGRVLGGRVTPGRTVRTTVELLLALLPGWQFERAPDTATGFDELVLQRRPD